MTSPRWFATVDKTEETMEPSERLWKTSASWAYRREGCLMNSPMKSRATADSRGPKQVENERREGTFPFSDMTWCRNQCPYRRGWE